MVLAAVARYHVVKLQHASPTLYRYVSLMEQMRILDPNSMPAAPKSLSIFSETSALSI